MRAKRKHAGIEMRRTRSGRISYRAEAYDQRSGKRVYRSFPTLAAAKAWRADTQTAIRKGTLVTLSAITVAEAAEELIAGMKAGTVRTRRGTPYKPSATRSYERALRRRVLPRLGPRKLSDIRRGDVQALIDELAVAGFDPSTIRNTLDPLRVVVRRALVREQITVNPMTSLEVPVPTGRRERITSPEEAAALIAALLPEDRALWATAMYAGLRRGELRALRRSDLDLALGVIRVERGWDDDPEVGEIEGKTRAARRTVPITARLRDHLVEHLVVREVSDDGFVFGVTDRHPFDPSTVRRRALSAWKRAALRPIALHQARHTFASIAIAAGLNAKALSSYMGHASVSITYDRYGHLMPGNEAEAAGLLDEYLLRSAEGQSRGSGRPTTADVSGSERSEAPASVPAPVSTSAE